MKGAVGSGERVSELVFLPIDYIVKAASSLMCCVLGVSANATLDDGEIKQYRLPLVPELLPKSACASVVTSILRGLSPTWYPLPLSLSMAMWTLLSGMDLA